MAIALSKDTQEHLTVSIKRFFSEELDEDIGDMKAGRVLDFVLREIAPSVYNQAIADARAYVEEKVAELGDVRYQPEFEFWKKR
jgi:uncharacterized protein (DUF2164 family)